MEIESCLFHSIKPYSMYKIDYNEPYEVLNDILKSRYIMTRKALQEVLSEEKRKQLGKREEAWQGDNAVCISCHPNNLQIIKECYFEDTYFDFVCSEGNNAWDALVQKRIPVIVLNQLLLKKMPLYHLGKRLPDEIQVTGNISLDFMEAIGFFAPEIIQDNKTLKLKTIEEEWKVYLKEIQKLLIKHNYEVPLINLANGEPFNFDENKLSKKFK